MRPGTPEAMVRCAGVSKRYGPARPWVLRDVDAEVMAGQVVHLDGPNGSDKSTLLRVLAGVSPPSRGERRAGSGCRVGFVPEAGKAPRSMTAGRYLRAHAGNGRRGGRGRAAGGEARLRPVPVGADGLPLQGDAAEGGAVPSHPAPETLGIALFLALAVPLAAELWRRRE
jgi:energy-coupling factor transporter ATP-binding protein EcfA2